MLVPEADSSVGNHTLAYLRRLDQRHGQLLELLMRQQDLMVRIDRDMREGFSSLQRELREGSSRADRDLREIKNDLVLAENNILNRLSEHYETSARLNQHDDRLDTLEASISS